MKQKKLTKKELAEQKRMNAERKYLNDINDIPEYDKRMKAILKAYDEGHTALFNWCKDYKEMIDRDVYSCVTMMVDYILKKSYEDNDTPFSYDDIDLQYIDYETLRYDLKRDEDLLEQFVAWYKDNNNFTELITKEEIDERIDDDELKEFLESENLLDDYETTREIYEWWMIGGRLLWQLERQGETILDGNIWGRECSGQSISLDGSSIRAFIDPLRETYGSNKQ